MKNRRLYQLAALARRDTRFSAKTQMFAAAVTATEMQFRPFWHRLVEYAYVLSLILMGKDAGPVSVGVSQISIRHFASLEGTNQFQSLFRAMAARKNLATCCKMIEAMDAKHLNDVRVAYNGYSTIYYRKALQRNYDLLRKIDARRANPKELPQ
jgi:hypothetical protein